MAKGKGTSHVLAAFHHAVAVGDLESVKNFTQVPHHLHAQCVSSALLACLLPTVAFRWNSDSLTAGGGAEARAPANRGQHAG